MLADNFDDGAEGAEGANSVQQVDFKISLGPLSCYSSSQAIAYTASTNRVMKHMNIKNVRQHQPTINGVATNEHKGPSAEHSDGIFSEMLHVRTPLNLRSAGKTVTPESKPATTNTLGFFSIIAVEVRQTIFALAMEVDKGPVYMKQCGCVPSHLNWVPDHCSKNHAQYPVGTGRFNLVYVSKQIRQEAMKIMYDRGRLHIDVNDGISKYLCGTRSMTEKWPPMWDSIAEFRHITIEVPPARISSGHPARFTDNVQNIVFILTEYLIRSNQLIEDLSIRSRTINLGSMFHSIVPFNITNQVAHRVPQLFDLISFQSANPKEPEFGRVNHEVKTNLHRIIRHIGKSPDRDCWKILVNTNTKVAGASRPTGVGHAAFRLFEFHCKRQKVQIAHTDRYDN